jgi:hypothetical protein
MLSSTAGPVAVGSKSQALPPDDHNVKANQSRKLNQLVILARKECDNHIWTNENELCTREQVVKTMLSKWPDVEKKWIEKIVRK